MWRFFLVISGTPSNPEAQSPPPSPPKTIQKRSTRVYGARDNRLVHAMSCYIPIRYGHLLRPTNDPSARCGAISLMVKFNVDDAKFTKKFSKIRRFKFFQFFSTKTFLGSWTIMAYQIQPYTFGSFRGDRRRTDGRTDRRHSETYIILICRVEEPTPSGFDKKCNYFSGCYL